MKAGYTCYVKLSSLRAVLYLGKDSRKHSWWVRRSGRQGASSSRLLLRATGLHRTGVSVFPPLGFIGNA